MNAMKTLTPTELARHHRAVLAGLLWAAAASGAVAGEVNLLEQRVQVSLGTFTNASRLDIRVDGDAGEAGTTVDWVDTFGSQDETRGRLDAVWRIADHHYLRVMYTDYSRSRTRTIENEIIWQGDVIPVDADATGRFGFEIIEAAYEYAFVKAQNFELTGSLGLHHTSVEASLTAEVESDEEQGTVDRGGRASVNAPLPVIGARTLWRFHDSLYLDFVGQAFYIAIDEYEGTILNARAAVTWQPKALLGLGLGYDWFRVDIDVDRPKFDGSLGWTYRGPMVFFNLSF
jgi:hypothetical protein